MWIAPIHDKEFVAEMISHVKSSENAYGTKPRMLGMLNVIGEELETPMYYHIPSLAITLNCQTPAILELFSAFLNSGYKVSVSHCIPQSLKTNAPQKFVWDVMRSWCTRNPVSEKKRELPVVKSILGREGVEVDWKRHPDADPPSRKIKLVRFHAPPPFWGPKARANKKTMPSGKKDGAPADDAEPKDAESKDVEPKDTEPEHAESKGDQQKDVEMDV
jgi:tRNA (guanine26-N2/guanine27-N2)-dimethyltransferase